jgi:hypothetical protein
MINVQRIASVDQIHFARRTGSVVPDELVVSDAIQADFGDPHQIPNVDDHLGMPDQEPEHVWIALESLRGHAPEIADIIDHGTNALGGIRSQLLKGETFDRCGPSLTRARAFFKLLTTEYLLLTETLLAIGLHWHRQTATESTPRDGESHKAMPKRRTYRDVENRLHR